MSDQSPEITDIALLLLSDLCCWAVLGHKVHCVIESSLLCIYTDSLTDYNQGKASGMDGTLALIFAISKTIGDSKKFIKKHLNTFKTYVKFQSLRDLA